MRAAGPYASLEPALAKRTLPALIVLALGLTVGMNALGRPLASPTAPVGIVSFELAGSLDQAQAILDSWDENARVHAGLQLGLDYLYLVAYAAAIGLACESVARSLRGVHPSLSRVGGALAWALLAAAALDAVENFALIRLLLGDLQQAWPALARACAIPKFAVIMLGLIYLVVGGIWLGLRELRARSRVGARGRSQGR